jgi:hypothetical protein
MWCDRPVQIIDAESEKTWPRQLLDVLSAHGAQVATYHATRAQIDRAAEADFVLRINRPVNPDKESWETVLRIAAQAVSGQSLLGFHATRLTAIEQSSVRKSGLRVLSEELLLERLAASYAVGQLSDAVAARLRGRHQARDDNRSGMIWFSFTRDPLRDESAVGRLFRSWGGEALYNSHESNAETGPALIAIGQPCIVLAAVPVDGLEAFMPVGERLVNLWCRARDISTGHAAPFEGYTRTNIPATNIRQVVSRGDTLFFELTAHGEWRKPLV